MASAANRAKAAAKRVRDKMKEAKGNTIRRGANIGTSYALGKAVETGAIERVPQLWGMPRTLTLAALGAAGAMYGSGKMADAAEGVLDSALAISAYDFGRGAPVQGVEGESFNEDPRDPLALTDGGEDWGQSFSEGDPEDSEWDSYDAALSRG